MPRFSSSLVKALLPRQVTYCAAVVGQHLLGRAVRGDRRTQHLQHQRRRLAGVQTVADDEAAVIVHEGDQVDPAVLPLEHEGEQVRLPQLVGSARSKWRTLSGCGRVGTSSIS